MVGNQGAASFSVDDAATATIAGSLTLGGPSSVVTVGGGTLQAQDGLSIGDQPADYAQLWVQGGTAAGTSYQGLLDWQQTLSVGDVGTGWLVVIDGGEVIGEPDSVLLVGGTTGSSGFVQISGSGSTLDIATASIGGAMPTATNDQGQPNGTDGDWTYDGGVGSLDVADNASVSAGQTLTLLAIAQIGTDGTETYQGGIDISSGGTLEVGGTTGAAANTLQIDKNAALVGHGLIDSDVVGHLPSPDGTSPGLPTYSLDLDNLGTVEAKDGLLVIHGNVTGDSQMLIDDNSSLEIGGTVGSEGTPDATFDFQGQPSGTLVINDIADFFGSLTGLSDGTTDLSGASLSALSVAGDAVIAAGTVVNSATVGSTINLGNIGTATNNAVIAATIGVIAHPVGMVIG